MGRALERHFDCARCGAHGLAVVETDPSRTPLGLLVDANMAGGDGMSSQEDATSTLGLVRCPVCGQRDRFAALYSVARVVGYTLGGLLVVILVMRIRWLWAVADSFWAALVALFATIGGAIELRRWRAAARVRFDKVRPGRELPVAIALVAPRSLVEPPPIEPLRTAAPDDTPHASDEDGPRVLKP